MSNVFEMLLRPAREIYDIIGQITKERQRTKGMINRILYEAEFNMGIIAEEYFENHADPESVIEKLLVDDLSQALDSGFDFRKLKGGTITEPMVDNIKFFQGWIGFDCEQTCRKIRVYLNRLKAVPELMKRKRLPNADMDRRFENMLSVYLLFWRFYEAE